MRAVAMLVLGMFIGVFGTVTTLGALRQDTPLTRGIMAVTKHHFGAAREAVDSADCRVEAVQAHLRTMRALQTDLVPAFLPTGGDDTAFKHFSGNYGQALDAALALPASDCAALAPAVSKLGDECKMCHRDFRP